MIGFEYTTARFPNTDVQANEVITWKSNYKGLLEVLGSLGTEVKRLRVIESDKDIKPWSFIRGASHDFIFPPAGDRNYRR